jgi:hypothetical protein
MNSIGNYHNKHLKNFLNSNDFKKFTLYIYMILDNQYIKKNNFEQLYQLLYRYKIIKTLDNQKYYDILEESLVFNKKMNKYINLMTLKNVIEVSYNMSSQIIYILDNLKSNYIYSKSKIKKDEIISNLNKEIISLKLKIDLLIKMNREMYRSYKNDIRDLKKIIQCINDKIDLKTESNVADSNNILLDSMSYSMYFPNIAFDR